MSLPIVLYDLARKVTLPEDNPWSPNTWKVRYALNAKGLPHKSVWVEYPDIEPLCKKIGAAPGGKQPGTGAPLYTLPVIFDPNTNAVVSDSAVIVAYLDKTYPSTPALLPAGTDALHEAFHEEYFRRTRKAWGFELEKLEGGTYREAWAQIKNGLHNVAGWLPDGADGKERLLFGGDKVIYADIAVASTLKWIQVVFGKDSEEWQDILRWDGGRWARFVEAFKKYDVSDAGSNLVL
ncbi:hypothetical protein C8Q74DRAFT_1369215 [Fomes fomentarius]|nr:hypothetical protein C8Q74DRAFT_1369215 [Fomes fomentarius]